MLLQVWSYGFTTSPTGQPDLDSQLAAGGSSSTNGNGNGGRLGSSGSSGSWQQFAGQQMLVPGLAAAEREDTLVGKGFCWGGGQRWSSSCETLL
jgi:hypothetical protein